MLDRVEKISVQVWASSVLTRPINERCLDVTARMARTSSMGILAGLPLIRAFEIAKSTAVPSKRWKGNTWSTYLYSVRTWERYGIHEISQLNRETVGHFKRSRLILDEVAPGTVNGDLAALLSILDELESQGEACEDLILMLRKARIPTRRPKARRAEHLSRRQVDTLCASARVVEPRAELAILVDVWSGVRVSELARMRREDFDMRGPVLHVHELPEMGQDGWAKTGPRTISVCAELRRLVENRPAGYIFPAGGSLCNRGKKTHREHLSTDCMDRDLRRVRDHAGMPWVTWNTLRHTRASWWAQAGVSRTLVAEWLGNSEEVCEQYYVGLPQSYHPDCEKAPSPEKAPSRIATPPSGIWYPS